MLTLYIGAVILSLIFIAFVLAAWRRAGKVAALQSQFELSDRLSAANVRAYNRQLKLLDQQLEEGQLAPSDYQHTVLELERNLLADSQPEKPRIPLDSPVAGKGLVIAFVIVGLFFAAFIYRELGSSGNVELFNVRNEVMNSSTPTIPHYIASFEQEARRQPNNPDVWAILYPLYRDSGQYDKAVGALRRIISISGHEPALDAELAQAEFFASGRQVTPEINALITKVENEDPQQPTINSLAGFIAFIHGDYQGAITHWRISLAGQQSVSDQNAIKGGIEIAQQRLKQQQASQKASSGQKN